MLLFSLIGCGMHTETGPTRHESVAIERDAAKSLRAELRMGAGSLKVSGGAPKWVEGSFAFNVESWKPEVKYTAPDGRGDLTIAQPESKSNFGNTTNEWDLKFNDELPTDLTAKVGAGEATMNLGSVSLRSLKIEMGAGELKLDLRGKPSHDYDVTIRGGAGEATVHVPKDAGIYAKAKGGIGEIKVDGLRQDGDHWVSAAYGTTKVQIHLDITGGVGQINIIAD